MDYMLDIGKVSEKIVFQKFGNFYVHVLNRVNSKKIGIYIFKIKKIGTEHRHGDFSRAVASRGRGRRTHQTVCPQCIRGAVLGILGAPFQVPILNGGAKMGLPQAPVALATPLQQGVI